MNSLILIILITFESCIYAKYLLVEIPVGQITDINSKESTRNQFLLHANKKSTPQKFQSLKEFKPDETSITSKGLSGNKNVLLS